MAQQGARGDLDDVSEELKRLVELARTLKSDCIQEKAAYEADPQNQADNFGFHINLFEIVVDWIEQECQVLAARGGNECEPGLLDEINLILREVSDVIWEYRERGLRQVVQSFPCVNISESQVNEKVRCAICLSEFEVGEEVR